MSRSKLILAGLALLAFAGCAHTPAPTARLEAPVVEPVPDAPQEPTLLERFQAVSRQQAQDSARADALAASCASLSEQKTKAESEVARLQAEVKSLTAKVADFDALSKKYDETQATCLSLEKNMRDIRRDLLTEKLANARNEQTILALKIEQAMDRRKQILKEGPAAPAPVPEKEANATP